MSDALPLSLLIKRALRERCPVCGEARLFSSYLKPVPQCPCCKSDFSDIRADDGPAWLTILLVCHIIVPSMIAVQRQATWSDAVAIPFWLVVTTLLTLFLLPKTKTLFIGVLWRNRHAGVGASGQK